MSADQNQGISFLGYVLGGLLLFGVAIPALCCLGSVLIGAFQ